MEAHAKMYNLKLKAQVSNVIIFYYLFQVIRTNEAYVTV